MSEAETSSNRTNAASLSGISASRKGPRMDIRVRRTRDSLGDALVALMQEMPFESITVQQVLDRANVGRSTFYQHFKDKDDLFFSDADEFFEMMATHLSRTRDSSSRVALVREFFAHVAEAQGFVSSMSEAMFNEVMELARGHFARGIEQRLRELPQFSQVAKARLAAMAYAHAGAMLSLLDWWIDHGMKETPEEMDQLFHQFVWGGVAGLQNHEHR